MGSQLPLLIGMGFLLGWSVAWPPGPINAEVTRRCMAGGFWTGFIVMLGASSGDALWAVLVSLGVGVLFAAPMMRDIMGCVSVLLLIALAFLFLRAAWRTLTGGEGGGQLGRPARFQGHKAGYLLGVVMALTSPWNVAFWIAAMGRPEVTGHPLSALLVMAAAVITGALTWGVIWSSAMTLLRNRQGRGSTARWWSFGVNLATGLLMLYFGYGSAVRLAAGG